MPPWQAAGGADNGKTACQLTGSRDYRATVVKGSTSAAIDRELSRLVHRGHMFTNDVACHIMISPGAPTLERKIWWDW